MRDLAQARDERLNSRGNTLSVCLSVCLVWVLNAKMADLIQDLITESLILVRSSPQQVSPVGSGWGQRQSQRRPHICIVRLC